MTTADETEVRLDTRVLTRLAGLICGDDTVWYRAGSDLEGLFRAAGWRRVRELDGGRRNWVLEQLAEHKDDPGAIRDLLLRLADPREYLDDQTVRAAFVAELNDLLAADGYRIEYVSGRPRVATVDQCDSSLAGGIPLELTAELGAFIQDTDTAAHLQSRLDDAHMCLGVGAMRATVIMLGSLLEGVLYDVASRRLGAVPSDKLFDLLKLARKHEWIAQDVYEYADVLRGHRNLVHPKLQVSKGYRPDRNSALIGWNVTVAALNQLAESEP